jgi:predicted component of type VI protein secretion system
MTMHLHVDRGRNPTTLHFSKLPIRIGRGEGIECRLEFPHVSRVHARIEMIDGRLFLVDEGSRLGTWVKDHSRRLQPGVRVDLSAVGSEFYIGPDLRCRVSLEEDEDTIQRPEPEPAPGAVDDDGMIPTTYYQDSNVDPQALDADAIEQALLEALADQRRASEHLTGVLLQAAACSPERVKHFAELVVEAEPEWDGRAAVRHFVTVSGIRPSPSRVDATALAVLQEIASSYVPYAPAISSPEAVAEFGTRLDTVLSLLIEGIAAMRYAVERESGAVPTDRPVRGELGACLLDWTNDGAYVRRLHGEIQFMLGHHRRLVDEVTQRLARILEHLSPEAIEKDPACKGRWWNSRRKAVWSELRRRHEMVVRLRERALGPVFGRVVRALKGIEGESSLDGHAALSEAKTPTSVDFAQHFARSH